VLLPRTLFGKLLLLFLAFGVLMTLVFLFVMRVSHEAYHREFDQTVGRELARQYASQHLQAASSPTREMLDAALRRITDINPEVDLYVLDQQGRIISAAPKSLTEVSDRVALAPVQHFLDARAELPIMGDDPAHAGQEAIFSAARLSLPQSPAAYLYVVLHQNRQDVGARQLRASYTLNEGAGVVLAAALFAVLGSLIFLRLLTRRLGELQQDVERFRDSRFEDLPPKNAVEATRGSDEIQRLRQLFVELADRIRAQMQQLQRTDEGRRELVANVSHDLRTPLTSLQAHLETLALKEDLPPGERQSYLTIALRQTRRLISLVEELLELAKLDAGQTSIAVDPFQLAELVYDVVMKFELEAKARPLTLGVEVPHAVPLVRGDIAMIERVLDNLIENALRYTPPRGRITVRIIRESSAARVEVANTGPPIPESQRLRIFERFFRGDPSRSSASGHAGLGLSIAHEILKLHGQSIECSTSEEGTTFFFALPTTTPQIAPAGKDIRISGSDATVR